MTFSAADHQYMSRALQLAEQGRYTTRPNPRVGCVIVSAAGEMMAEGSHYRAGEPHAEINALQMAENKRQSVVGATVYVTLEPCSHQGRTGSCAVALMEANIGRMVYAVEDPNPQVSGAGLALLREAGVTVDGPLLQEQAHNINRGFIKRMQQQRPWVTCKLAASLDGRTAMENGDSQWITGSAARGDVQRLRAQSCAVITGIGSIRQDNSRLNLRAEVLDLPNKSDVVALLPWRVVLDTDLTISSGAAVFASPGTVILFAAEHAANEELEGLLSEQQASVIIERVATSSCGLNLDEVLQVLAKKYECNEVLLEAGATLAGSFLQVGLLDEVVLYQAPVLMGSAARPLFALPLHTMTEKRPLVVKDIRQIGDDIRITFKVASKNALF